MIATSKAPSSGTTRSINWADKHYLVIDDCASIRQLLRESLRSMGAKFIDQAMDGSEAVALINNKRYDIIMCDYHLEGGRNGQQILEEARGNNWLKPSGIFIMVSAEKSADSVMGTAEFHPDAYLIKPITEGMLNTRLNRIWQKKQVFQKIDLAYARKDFAGAAALCDIQIAGNKLHEHDLLRMKASLLLKCGERAKARAIYTQVLCQRECTWAKAGLAELHLQDGDYGAACQMFQDVIDGNHLYLDAYDQLAAAHKQLGQQEQASTVLEQAARLSPNSVNRQRTLGEVSLRLGNVAAAEKAFRKCISVGEHSISRTADPYFGLARACGIRKAPLEALQILATVQKKFAGDAGNLRARITEGLVYLDNDDQQSATAIAEEFKAMLATASAGDLPLPDTCMDIATLLLEVGIKEPAVKLLCYIIQNNDDDKSVRDEVQKVFEHAQMGEEGAELIEGARKEASEVMNRGVLLWKTNRLEDAVDWMRAARLKLPGNLRILLNTAQILISHVQKRGYDPALLAEAAEVLALINRMAPGQRRHTELLLQLGSIMPDILDVAGQAVAPGA
ncbi:response regulator [Rugamonas sp. DEMB1]|uniref:response regulator n=1 Tax=Rugamonas sp. DEMB1 TaxID=3039386 RepID=UPI00244B98EE|nr:response regulator [Rugamonas sp. DEMB1]WGG53035.1 response regulator [Rugamonas sp. DEMB1]